MNYKDKQTDGYKAAVAWRAAEAWKGKPLEGPLGLVVSAILTVPESWNMTKREMALAGDLRPTGVPDFDNIAKFVDGIKGIIWNDDAQVVDARVLKFYGPVPFVQFEVLTP